MKARNIIRQFKEITSLLNARKYIVTSLNKIPNKFR